jgi:hypothetical protein
MFVVLTLNFFLFEPKFVLVLRLTRLSSSRRLAGMTADLACQMSSCLCQDYNILLLFKRDILYTGNVEYILLCLCFKQQKIIKIKQAFKIYNNHEHLVISSGKSSALQVSMEIWRMRNKFPSCCFPCEISLSTMTFSWKHRIYCIIFVLKIMKI